MLQTRKRDDYGIECRPEGLSARVNRLNSHILEASTVSQGLETWCQAQRIGGGGGTLQAAVLSVRRGTAPFDDTVHAEIGNVGGLVHRQVKLVRGGLVLAVADVWYAEDRLTPEMRDMLETTNIPFGWVVAPLLPVRQNFAVITQDFEGGWHNALDHKPILEHRAYLTSDADLALAVTREVFLETLLTTESQTLTAAS